MKFICKISAASLFGSRSSAACSQSSIHFFLFSCMDPSFQSQPDRFLPNIMNKHEPCHLYICVLWRSLIGSMGRKYRHDEYICDTGNAVPSGSDSVAMP